VLIPPERSNFKMLAQFAITMMVSGSREHFDRPQDL